MRVGLLGANPVSYHQVELGHDHRVGDVEALLMMCSFGHSSINRLRFSVEHELKKPSTNKAGPELMCPVRVIGAIKVASRSSIVGNDVVAQSGHSFDTMS